MRILLITLLACFTLQPHAQESGIWWEGESTTDTNFPEESWFSEAAESGRGDLLSENAWLTNAGEREGDEAFARYVVSVPEAGTYDLWARKLWKHGPFRWRFGSSDWTICGPDIALADSVTIATHIPANWVYLGEATLEEGDTTFELRLLAGPGEQLTAGFDCFFLTQQPFVPRGQLKPWERSGDANEGFFAWEPPIDVFSEDSWLDLRDLNEAVAGENGFIRAEGNGFVLGDGTPVRFWAVNASSAIAAQNRKAIRSLARQLARRGVNMVRYHSRLFKPSTPYQVDETILDNLHHFVWAMKQEGIYTKVSFFFPLWMNADEAGLEGYDEIENNFPFKVLFYHKPMQQMYRAWLEGLLTTPNPYTSLPLASDPACAIVELLNEDSLFFWTLTKENVPAVHWAELETRFHDWLVDRYGTIENARDAWDGYSPDGDSPDEGRMEIFSAWHMTGSAVADASEGRKARIGDQVRFFTELQRGFYEDTTNWIKRDLGYKGLVSASNWRTADEVMLGALERYTYTPGDLIDRHGYFDLKHSSPDGSHAYDVRTGHTFKNINALTIPDRLPIQSIQLDGYPQIISEIMWTNPNAYRADYSFMKAVYGSLQGIDGIYSFALGGPFWDTTMKKFVVSSPAILGNFPAYALLYRRGDLPEAEPVVEQVLRLEDLYAMQGSGGAEAQAFDALRLADIPAGELAQGEVTQIDPLAYYVGPVKRRFGDDPSQSREANLKELINRDAQTVQSRDGRVKLDFGSGFATLDLPTAQGAAGFLDTVSLSDVEFSVGNEYASVIAIAMDNEPLYRSSRILIQTMTIERPFGFKASDGLDGTIEDMGGYPLGLEEIDISVQLSHSHAESLKVTVLDENGMPRETTALEESGNGAVRFALPKDAVYCVVHP